MSDFSVPMLQLLEWTLRNINLVGSVCWNLALLYSVLWLIYRIYLVCQKPNSELVEILGIDIPPEPEVALAGITTDSVILYWKPPENYASPLKHVVQVNGINVDEFSTSEESVQITNLQPGTFYGIRAIATNTTNNLSSQSRLIQVQTIPLTGHERSRYIATLEQAETQSHGKQNGKGRRSSGAMGSGELVNGHPVSSGSGSEDPEPEENMKQLTRKLDVLRQRQEETDRQIAEDIAENEKTKAALSKERDELRQKVEEKERAHLELKKQVNETEKQCKAAQRKKSAKERLLQQKKAERQKRSDEIALWKKECYEIRKENQALEKEKAELEEAHQKKMAEIRRVIDEANADNKTLEEEIRVWGIKIKASEEERRRTDIEQDEEAKEAERREKEEEEAHEKRLLEYQTQIEGLWKANQQVEMECQQADDRLKYWLSRKGSQPHAFAPIHGLDFPTTSTVHSSRRLRQGASRASTISQASSVYPINSSPFNSMSGLSPTFANASSYFNMSNGTTASGNSEQIGLSQQDLEGFFGGAPMSPDAQKLLPSDLLGDDDGLGDSVSAENREGRPNNSHRHSYMSITNENNNQDPNSPMSLNSRSPSLISSPRESLQNLHGYYPTREQFTESDRHSVQSAGSPFANNIATGTNALNGRKLTGLFNFNRQRGKSAITEAPLLGTLKQGQSQSFPRNFDQEPLDALSPGRRRIGSGNWTNPMSNFLARNTMSSTSGTDGDTSRLGFGRRGRLHMFGPKLDTADQLTTMDRSDSPRPSSTYSHENALPRPSSDSHPFGWAPPDSVLQRSSHLGTDWSSIGGSGPWSRAQSRRASIQHGSTSNLSIGSTPLDPSDFSSPYTAKLTPAPIGTGRGKAKQRAATPKLNPAAPSFTTRLFSRNDTKKSSKGDKVLNERPDNLKTRDLDKSKDLDSDYAPEFDSSPSASRLSKDAHSITTATSVGESHDSLDHAVSSTPSDGVPASTPKESLMQRITRKSSSSKFNIPWSKDRTSLFSKKAGEPSTPGEVDEDGASDFLLGKSVDSAASTPQTEKSGRPSLSWSRVMRKSKKGEKEASESSERASETETGDEL